jgi:hypothetical protein
MIPNIDTIPNIAPASVNQGDVSYLLSSQTPNINGKTIEAAICMPKPMYCP